MAKYIFTPAERHGLYVTHGDRCYLCREPIDMLSFQVDHIIPEELLSAPERLAEVLQSLGRPDDFQVNSFENWLPACGPCNNRKRARIFEPAPIVLLELQRAGEKADAAREASQRIVTDQALAKAANTLARAAAEGQLTESLKARLRPLLQDYAAHKPATADREFVRVTPTYEVPLHELLSDDGQVAIARGPYGIGGGPSLSRTVSPAMLCASCGGRFFSGTRCTSCGAQGDD